ncbi:unnamed protein product [Mytilus edulis]|uniref:DDE Tnp4 domain-containing protein n=1 Tax=Mytilus edulis TaxID=6550 RepID=A0A8S3UCN6_MYTED|nr:unnamed protein product [Mytilus edulis]
MRKRYGFGRHSIAYICNSVGDKFRRSKAKETALTVEQQVYIALRCYVSVSFLQVIGDTIGYDKATVSRAGNLPIYMLTGQGQPMIPTYSQHIKPMSLPEDKQQRLADGLILGDSGYLPAHNYEIKFQVRMKPEKVCRVIGACAVLNNKALTRNVPLEDICGVHVQHDQPVQVPNFEGEQDGRHIREHIARVFFN